MKNGWKRLNLKDVCTSIVDCINKTAKFVDFETPYKMLRTTNIKKGWVDLEHVRYVTKETYEKWTRRQLPKKGDVILTREAPLGEVGLLRTSDKVFLGQRLVAYRVNPEKLDHRFLLYSFLSHDLVTQIRALGSGSTVEHMRVPDAEKLSILLPDISTQEKISSVVATYDDFIENNQKRIKILEQMSQILFTEWFVKLKFPGHEKFGMVSSDSEQGMIPEGWKMMKFGDVVYLNPKTKIIQRGEVLHIQMEALSNSISVIDFNKGSRRNRVSGPKFQNGDTLFARITPCMQNGKNGFVNFLAANEVACGSTEFVVIRSKVLTPHFIYFLTRTANFREAARLTMVGASGRQRVQSAFFQNHSVLVPVAPLMKSFEAIVENNFVEMTRLYRLNSVLTQMRDLIIPQLVTGKRLLK